MSPRVVAFALLVVASALSPPARAAPAAAELHRAQAEAASAAHAAALAGYKAGTVALEVVYTWSLRWMLAERAQAKTRKAKAAAATLHLERMESLAAEVAGRVAGGLATPLDQHAAAFYRAEAEAWVHAKRP